MKKKESQQLAKAAKRSHNVLTRIDYLQRAADAAMQGNPEKAMQLIEEANKEAALLDNGTERRLINNIFTARALILLDRLRESQALIDEGWEYVQNTGNKRFRILYVSQMVEVLEHRGDYAAALKFLDEEMPPYHEIESDPDRMNFLSKKGHLLLHIGMLAEAEELLSKGLALAEKVQDDMSRLDFFMAQEHDFRMLEGGMLNSLGKLYGDRGDYETALEYFGNALLSARESNDARNEAVSQINIAQAWQKLGMNERALPYFFFAMNGFIGTGDKYHQTICYCGISEAFLALGNLDAAKDNAEQAHELALAIGYSPILKKHVEEALAKTFEKIGEADKALEHYKYAMQASNEKQPKELVGNVLSARISQERDETQKTESDLQREINRLETEVDTLRSKLREQTLKNVQKQEALETSADILNNASMQFEKKTMPKLKEVISVLRSADDKNAVWLAYEQELERQSPDFMKRLLTAYPTLTRSEIRICSLLAIQMSTKNIAAMLYLDKKTVDKHRQNIRRKMKISSTDDLALHIAMLCE